MSHRALTAAIPVVISLCAFWPANLAHAESPATKQGTNGGCSPNIIGNGNIIIYHDCPDPPMDGPARPMPPQVPSIAPPRNERNRARIERPSCDQLWIQRNTIYKERGYCFHTARPLSYFSNAGCIYDHERDVPLTPDDRAAITQIIAEERSLGCRAN